MNIIEYIKYGKRKPKWSDADWNFYKAGMDEVMAPLMPLLVFLSVLFVAAIVLVIFAINGLL